MSNPNDPTHQIAETVLAELDHFQARFRADGGALTYASQVRLKDEPFVAYAKAEDKSGRSTQLLISRHYVPFGLEPRSPDTEYASYLSPLGRIVSKKVGQAHEFQVKRSGMVLEDHKFRLVEKDEFRVHRDDGRWDAIDNTIAWLKGAMLVRSLRRVLLGEAAPSEGRALRYSVSLPDKAILDEMQDDIFRLPLARRVRISGAPGTGKTTVLLKRLSQKTKKEFLTEEEQKGIRDQDWKDGHNWMLFTPSDLLKVYLKEAMARELLPASDEHVKVYRTFRLETLRDIGFIKVGERGYFRVASPQLQLVKRSTGAEQLALARAFETFLGERYTTAFVEAVKTFGAKTRSTLNLLTDASQKVLVAALNIMSKATADPVELRHAQERAASYRRLNEGLNKLIQNVRNVLGLELTAAQFTVTEIYRQARSFVSLAGSLNTENLDAALFPEVRPLLENLRQHLQGLAESLSLARLAQLIPRAYQEFREDAGHLKRFYLEESEKPVRDRLLTEPEQDVLLFHILEFVRRLYDDLPVSSQTMPNEIRQVLLRMRLLVTVDEAADFSPLELACMERFAMPVAGGVTICGDLMQRVTEQGLKDWSEMSDLSASLEVRDLKISYRQTERLFSIAKDLFTHATGTQPDFSSAYPKRPEDPPPLSFKPTETTATERWLTDRICEIHSLCNDHLPTTAVLVPLPSDVGALKARLAPLLMENGFELDGSEGGQNLGDSARVRIFPVECIKGLEFEAVFYVGLDRMAEVHKDLIDKYVYVGLSRARSFLGVIYERQFPARLKCIAEHFQQDGAWVVPKQ